MYAARHSAATHLRNAGVPAALVSVMMGTSEAMLHQHYYGGAKGDVADALRKLG